MIVLRGIRTLVIDATQCLLPLPLRLQKVFQILRVRWIHFCERGQQEAVLLLHFHLDRHGGFGRKGIYLIDVVFKLCLRAILTARIPFSSGAGIHQPVNQVPESVSFAEGTRKTTVLDDSPRPNIDNIIVLHGNVVTVSECIPDTQKPLRRGPPRFVPCRIDSFGRRRVCRCCSRGGRKCGRRSHTRPFQRWWPGR